MSKTNYKGKFIEWTMANTQSFELKLVEITGYDHSPRFCYELIVENYRSLFSDYCSTKKEAQHNVCKKFLDKNVVEKEPDFQIYPHIHYYIDLENCANIDLNMFDSNQCDSFASIGSASKVKKRATVITACTRSDAADVALIAKLTEDIVFNRYPEYAVISRDKLLLTATEVLSDIYNVKIESIII